jgi:prolyl-tRNA synthetase
MGCYGLGTTRVMGVLAEVLSDDAGLVWPDAVAPANVHIVPIAKAKEEDAFVRAEELHDALELSGFECLLDDRIGTSVGSKMADADLIGIPKRIVVSEKTLKEKGVEVKDRASGEVTMIRFEEVEQYLRNL